MCPVKMSKIESGIRTVLDFNKACNRHDVPGIMQLMHDDCVFEHFEPAPDGAVYLGKEEIAQFWANFFREMPDAQIKIQDISGFGKQCIMIWKLDWADETGAKKHLRGADIFQVEDGLICEVLSYVKANRHNLESRNLI